jgi:hypothetical protein
MDGPLVPLGVVAALAGSLLQLAGTRDGQ